MFVSFFYELPHTTIQSALTSGLARALHPDACFARSGFTHLQTCDLRVARAELTGWVHFPSAASLCFVCKLSGSVQEILLSAGCTCQMVQAPALASAHEEGTQKPPGLVGGLAVGPRQSCPAGDPGCGAVLTPPAPPGCILGGLTSVAVPRQGQGGSSSFALADRGSLLASQASAPRSRGYRPRCVPRNVRLCRGCSSQASPPFPKGI